MYRFRTAVFGTGFVGRVHLDALRRLGYVEIAAIAESEMGKAQRLAEEFDVPRAEQDYRRILEDRSIKAVHICTPNYLHYAMARDSLAAGKHVLCEKPLALSVEEARALVDLAEERRLRNCTFHNLRFYPMVQHMRHMRVNGDLGEILVVEGTYSQDWLLLDTDWNWRLESKTGGKARCFGDIGSHWSDMAEHVTGLQVTSLIADFQTFHKVRKRPLHSVETFASKLAGPEQYVEVPIDTEDFGAVLFRMGERVRGCFTASQVSAGRKNRLVLEVYGTKAGVAWDQERPDELWIGYRERANQIIIKDPALLKDRARPYAELPGGHSEGYDDTFKQVFRRFYHSIEDPTAEVEYPQFADGLRQMVILDTEMRSNQEQAWLEVPGAD
ncbi:MAG TPA: Gfo/Idh/MocA family oxidoreductase [Bryobacteraceae bacterium]